MKAIIDVSSLLMMIKYLKEKDLLNKLKDIATLDLAFYEVGNGFWKWVSLMKIISKDEVEVLIKTLIRILLTNDFTMISWKDLNHLAILNLAIENNITFYDASYIIASATFKKIFVTEDEKLKRIATRYVQVLSWRDI
jgi:predicted nucleic acid-binding protein